MNVIICKTYGDILILLQVGVIIYDWQWTLGKSKLSIIHRSINVRCGSRNKRNSSGVKGNCHLLAFHLLCRRTEGRDESNETLGWQKRPKDGMGQLLTDLATFGRAGEWLINGTRSPEAAGNELELARNRVRGVAGGMCWWMDGWMDGWTRWMDEMNGRDW